MEDRYTLFLLRITQNRKGRAGISRDSEGRLQDFLKCWPPKVSLIGSFYVRLYGLGNYASRPHQGSSDCAFLALYYTGHHIQASDKIFATGWIAVENRNCTDGRVVYDLIRDTSQGSTYAAQQSVEVSHLELF